MASTTALTGVAAALAFGAGPAGANPRGGTVVGGQAAIATPVPGTVEIRQITDKAIIEWQDFSVGEREHTRFQQPSSGSIALNRVVGGIPSEILGRLSANGQVWLVNPNGIVFGRNAQVDVSGLVATTHDIRNDDFMAGRHRFEGGAEGTATVENHGTITVNDAGLAALVAPGVSNKGTITARLGEVHLASGRKFVVDLYGDQRINLATDAPVTARPKGRDGKPVDALVRNEGRIFADGGKVRLSAAAAKGIVDRVVDMSGVVQARTVEQRDGEIILSGGDAGTVHVTGTLDATGAAPGARGGTVGVTGERVVVASGARIDVSGRAGGGEALVGGDYLGGRATPQQLAGFSIRPARKPVPPATTTLVEAGAVIAADATEAGRGGKAIVWSDGHTRFHGAVSAKGGPNGGDGGFVEASGKQRLGYDGLASVDAPRGLAGNIFLDPNTLTIQNGAGTLNGSLPTIGSGDGGASETVSVASLEQISSGTITLTAPGGITVADLASGGDGQINLRENVSLSLHTNNGTISFANPANAIIAQGTGSITMEAGYDSGTNYNGQLSSIGRLQTAAGNIVLRAADGVALAGTLTTNGGSINIDADGDQAGGGGFTSSVDIATNGGNLSVKGGSGGVTLNGNVTLGAGTVTFSTTSGYTGTYTLGGQLSLSGNVALGQPITLKSGAGITTNGTVSFTNTVTVQSGANLVLTANGFQTTSSINGQGGTLTLKPYDTTRTGRLSGTPGANEVDLSTILPQLSNFTQVSYDNASGTGGVAIGAGLSTDLPLSISAGGGITADGAVAVGSGQSLGLASTSTVTVNGPLSAGGAVTLAAGTLSVGGTVTGPSGITLTADTLSVGGGADSLVTSGPVVLQPYSTGRNITVAGSAAGTLSLTTGILGSVKSTASSLTIGRSDGKGTITVQPYTFATDTTLRTPGAGSGGIGIGGALSVGTKSLTLKSGGPVTQTAAITADKLELLGTGGSYTLGHAGNSFGTLAGDTGSVDLTYYGSLSVGTANTAGLRVSDSLMLHTVGGDLTVSQNIEKSGTGYATATLRSNGSVILDNGADLQLATGASGTFAVTINPDRDGDGQGAAHLGSGTQVSSNGGTIQIGGGSAVDGAGRLTGAARGLTGRIHGIQLDGATLNAGGGDILLTGIGAGAATAAGVDLSNGATVQTSGTGAVTITGTSGTGAFAGLRGVNLGDSADSSTQSIVTADGALTVTGVAATGANGVNAVGLRSQSGSFQAQGGAVTLTGRALGGTGGARGIELNGRTASKSLTTGTGAIALTGLGGGTGGSANQGIVQYGDFTIGSTSGAVTLTATGGFGSVDYASAGTGTDNRVGNGTIGTVTIKADTLALDKIALNSTGLVAILPRTAGRGIDLGSATDTATSLELSDAELDRITAGTLRIGDTGSGAIAVSAAISPANAATLSLVSGQSVAQSGSGAVTATSLRVSAGGAVDLGTNSNSIGTLAMTGSGNAALSFRNDSSFAIGRVDGDSGIAAGTGNITLTSGGTVIQSQPINGAGLALLGSAATYTLTDGGNAVSTLAGDAGTVSYTDTDGVTIGTVGTTAGLTVRGTTLTLSAGGAIAQSAALTNVGRLVLSAGGAIDLDESGVANTVTTLGAVTRGGAFGLSDSAGGLSIDGAVGGHASDAAIRTTGDLTVTANGTVAATGAGSVVLAATGGNFTNSRGSDAVSLGTGRWLIYAATRDGSTEGGLSGTREYTRSYAANAPSSVARSGNVFLYGNTPLITVTFQNATREYGDTASGYGFGYSGVLAGDTAALAYAGAAEVSSGVASLGAGTHSVTPVVGSLTSPTGYGFTYAPGTLTVTPAPLSATAANQTRVYGDSDPTLGYSVSGLKGSDTASGVLSGSMARTAGENVGSYAIGQGSLASNGNYTLFFTGGTLSITPAPLTIAADSASRLYGSRNPTLTGSVTGLRNGDTAAGLGVSYGTAATTASDVGRYAITPGVASASNYSVTLTPGTLTVNPAPLTVTADDAARAFGTANPAFTARYEGFVLGQGPGVLGGTLGFTTPAGMDSPAGSYAVTAFGLTSGNYDLRYAPGTLTVSPVVSTPTVVGVVDRAANPTVTIPPVEPPVKPPTVPDRAADPVAAVPAAVNAGPRGDTPAVLLARLATGEALAPRAAESPGATADAAARMAAAQEPVTITLAGRPVTFSPAALAAHAAGQSLNGPSPALLASPQVREGAANLLDAARLGQIGGAMSSLSTLSTAEQKAAFQSVSTAEMINGLLNSDDPTARAVGGLLQDAVSGGAAGYADVKAAVQGGGVPPAMMKTYLALYQHVQREQRTGQLGGALQALVSDPAAADLFGRAGQNEPPRIVALTAPRDAGNGQKVVEGRIEQSGLIREARVNGRWVFVDDQGRFSTNLPVAEGQNEVVLTVTDESGAVTERRITVNADRASPPQADAPPAGRKIALMIATDSYQNPLIPPLKTPGSDVAAVGEALNERLGYETRVLKNPTKAQIVETMRALGREIGEQDQVLLYYAGHGYEVAETGTGYWLPADADASDPKNWVSNNDVARFLNRMPARQILVVSDSCYSGAFTREQKVDPSVAQKAPDQLLGRRSVMAMSSGGDEPVADGDTNSPFAEALMSRVRQMPRDSGGYELFAQVRDDVTAEVPQTPQYGVIKAAGYDEGGDYLLGVKQPQRSASSR